MWCLMAFKKKNTKEKTKKWWPKLSPSKKFPEPDGTRHQSQNNPTWPKIHYFACISTKYKTLHAIGPLALFVKHIPNLLKKTRFAWNRRVQNFHGHLWCFFEKTVLNEFIFIHNQTPPNLQSLVSFPNTANLFASASAHAKRIFMATLFVGKFNWKGGFTSSGSWFVLWLMGWLPEASWELTRASALELVWSTTFPWPRRLPFPWPSSPEVGVFANDMKVVVLESYVVPTVVVPFGKMTGLFLLHRLRAHCLNPSGTTVENAQNERFDVS